MERALVGICYDSRQRRILDRTFPSWRAYGKKHNVPVIIVERTYAGEDFYWNKHLLYQVSELRSFEYLLFLDNDVLVRADAGSLLKDWNSPLIGVTCECTQAGWSGKVIEQYYDNYFVERSPEVANLRVLNTGVLIIPRGQADFLKSIYRQWKNRMECLPKSRASRRAPFALQTADQPHVSYALQANRRFADFGERFNTLWWHWYKNNISQHNLPFLLRSKAAALTTELLPTTLWHAAFRRERAIFDAARDRCDFLHVAGSKSPLFLSTDT